MTDFQLAIVAIPLWVGTIFAILGYHVTKNTKDSLDHFVKTIEDEKKETRKHVNNVFKHVGLPEPVWTK